jgi:hypothetical protein
MATPSARRRRLVLGAAGALPTVYTLSSGAAAAATSAVACWSQGQQGTAPQRFTVADDQWYRVQVYDGKYQGAAMHCVSSPQSACVEGTNQAKAGSYWVSDSGTRVQAGMSVNVNSVSSAPKSYGLVYVNQEGTISTLDPNGQMGLSYCADSCWTSVMGGRISQLG